MTPERWQQVTEIFSRASELEAAALARYLDEACAGDVDLRREVESLLAAHHSSRAIVDRFAAEYVPEDLADDPDRWRGRRVGAYELLELLGRGGMGEVYRARRADAHYEKEVAIKFVRGGFDTDLVLRRFRAERQILANLDHPNIARLVDGSATEDGLPYLVMELVVGQPIDVYCEERALPIAERLRLFREVCAAVSYAHQHLVVHRDLKPRNILVTREGSIKLLDFGIAKLLDDPADAQSNATLTAISAMTPAFSSPEQIMGRPITTASDVYSLGVVLFHLLTGRSPYRNALTSTHDAIKEVCETDPLKPSAAAVAAGVPRSRPIPDRDLDDVTLMALRKEPEQRYRSVEHLSEDIQGYLTGLPVMAHTGRYGYRAAKFVRRHKLEIAAAALVALSLIGGVIVSTHQAHVAQREQARAERDFARTRKLANSLLFEVHDAIADLTGSTAARSLLVTRALQYLDELAHESSGDRSLAAELASAYRRVGDIQGGYGGQNEGDMAGALASYRKSVAQFERVIASNPADLGARGELSRSLRRLALAQANAGDVQLGLQTSARAVSVAKQVVAADEGKPNRLHDLMAATSDYCEALRIAGNFKQALATCRESIEEQQRVVQALPLDPNQKRLLAVTYDRTAATLIHQVEHLDLTQDPVSAGLLRDAIALERRALAIDTSRAAADANDGLAARDMLADRSSLAAALYVARDFQGALEVNSLALEGSESAVARDPNNVSARINDALVRRNRGQAYVALGKSSLAVADFTAALGILRALSKQQVTSISRNEQAAALLGLGSAHELAAREARPGSPQQLTEWRAAERAFADSLELFRQLQAHADVIGADPTDLNDAQSGLERSRTALGSRLAANNSVRKRQPAPAAARPVR